MYEDIDPLETQEWLDSMYSTIRHAGKERAAYLIKELINRAMEVDVKLPPAVTTPFRNTIPPHLEKRMPGDLFMERRIRSLTRWNALAMVMRANDNNEGLGGHIASFSSAATLYDVGFNYFFRGNDGEGPGDLIYFQGHSSPGMYARSYLEGRLTEEQMDNFRREVDGGGLSSYPHPWLMPNYWQFPTVSMGLGPLQAIYQAYFMRYMEARELTPPSDRRVWAFWEMVNAMSLKASAPSPWRAARGWIIWSLLSIATCSVWMGQCGVTARSFRSWKEFSRRWLECNQGGVGSALGSALCQRQNRSAAKAHGRSGGW